MRAVRRSPLRIRALMSRDAQGAVPSDALPRIGFILRRSTGPAVMRNRCKRVLRHQLADVLRTLPADAWQHQAVYVVSWQSPPVLSEAGITMAADIWRQWLLQSPAPQAQQARA